MLHYLRKHQASIMLGAAILIIISMVFWGDSGSTTGRGSTSQGAPVFSQFGRKYTRQDIDLQERYGRFSQQLQIPFIREIYMLAPPLYSTTFNQLPLDYYINLVTLKRALEQAGIEVTTQEVTSFVSNFQLPPEVLRNLLGGFGLQESDAHEAFSLILGLQKLRSIGGSNISGSEAWADYIYRANNQVVTGQAWVFPYEDHAAEIQISDEELEKHYQARPNLYTVGEKRAIQYAIFPKAEEPENATEEQIEAAKKAFDEKIQSFYELVSQENAQFAEEAQKAGAEVTETDYFTKAEPAAALTGELVVLQQDVWRLNEANPMDSFSLSDGRFLIYKLKGEIQAARPKTLEEAKEEITEELRFTKAQELTRKKVAEVTAKIQEALDAKKSVETITQELALKGIPFTRIPLNRQDQLTYKIELDQLDTITQATRLTAPGKLSEALPYFDTTPPAKEGEESKPNPLGGGFLIATVTAKELYKKDDIAETKLGTADNLGANEQYQLVTSWFQSLKNQGDTKLLGRFDEQTRGEAQ